MAADTVERVEKFQSSKIIRTIEFNSIALPKRPSLWDLMILAYVVHEDSTAYELLGRQCFWFADTISAILEKWSTPPTDEATTTKGKSTKSSFLKRKKSAGRVGILVVHRRKPDVIDKIWEKFLKQRENMNAEVSALESASCSVLKESQSVRNMKMREPRSFGKRKNWRGSWQR